MADFEEKSGEKKGAVRPVWKVGLLALPVYVVVGGKISPAACALVLQRKPRGPAAVSDAAPFNAEPLQHILRAAAGYILIRL